MAGSRTDGRGESEMRPLSATLGKLDRADGSAKFGFGGASALASVTGPIEVRLREELPDKATLEIVHRPLEGVNATPSRALINTLSSVLPPLLHLGQHPRSLIQLVIQSLSPAPYPAHSSVSYISNTWPSPLSPEETSTAPMSGKFFSNRAAALNAGSLALLDTASVAMRGIAIAVSLAYLGEEGGLVIDPTNVEESKAESRFVFAWAFGSGMSTEEKGDMEVDDEDIEAEIVWTETEGDFTRDQFETAMQRGQIAAREVLRFFRTSLGEHLATRLQR